MRPFTRWAILSSMVALGVLWLRWSSGDAPPADRGNGIAESPAVVVAPAPQVAPEPQAIREAPPDDLLLAPPQTTVAPEPRAVPGEEEAVVPTSPQQREMFIDMVLTPHFKKIVGSDLEAEYRERHQRRLRGDLAPGERAAANAALELLVSAQVAMVMAKNAALVDYVRQAPSLAKPAETDPRPHKGVGGVVTHGMEPEWRRYWGDAKGIRVSYWLSFEAYPGLAAANRDYLRARETFDTFAAKR